MTDNVALVRRIYDATANGDVETVVRECDPEVEYISLVSAVEGGRSYRGHEGMRKFFSDLREAWDVWRGSGLDLQFEWGQVLHFRNGKVLHGRLYGNQEEAEAAFRALS